MPEIQHPGASKVVPLQKPEPKLSALPKAPAAEIASLPPDLQAAVTQLVGSAVGECLARHNQLLAQNIAQATAQATEPLREMVEHFRQERDLFKNTAEAFVAQATEVQQGRKAANAAIFSPDTDGEKPHFANLAISGQEAAYPLFSKNIADELGIAPTMVHKLAKAAGIWEVPDYHAYVKSSPKVETPRYKPRAIAKMRAVLENPLVHGVNPQSEHWQVIKHYCRRNGVAIDTFLPAKQGSLFLPEP